MQRADPECNTPTRIDPATGKGSVLDLAIVSKNIANNVEKFYVDTNLSYTPFSMTKVNDIINKKYTDHRAIILQINLPLLLTKVDPKRIPVIDVTSTLGTWRPIVFNVLR